MRRTNVNIKVSVRLLLCAAFFTLHASLFTSCTREDDIQTVMEEYDPTDANGTYDEAHWRRVHAAQRQAYIGDLYRSYGVGYGYNGTGKYSNYDEVRDRIIDLSVIQKFDEEHGSSTVVDDVSPSSYHHVFSGNDAMTICHKLTANASVKVDMLLFQGEASTTFSQTDMVSNEYAFCIINDGLTLASRHLEPYDLYHIAREHPEALSPGFLRYQQMASDAINKSNHTEAMRIIQGKKTGTEKKDWVVNTQEDRETHIEVLGGNSALATEFIGLHESDDMSKKSKAVDAWFKSLKFDPTADKDSSNVELIDIKVAPVSDLIVDPQVAAIYNAMVGKHVVHETNVMPRVRNAVYAKIPVSMLKLSDRSVTNQLVSNHEVIGEIHNEYVHNVEYSVFYPTIGGKMAREGLGRRCSDDSLFTITWQYLEDQESQAKAYVTPLVRINYDDYFYYNNGDVDISPAPNVTSYTTDVEPTLGAIYIPKPINRR